MTETMRIRGKDTESSPLDQDVDRAMGADGGIEIEVRRVIDVSHRARSEGEELEVELAESDVVEYRTDAGWADFATVGGLRSGLARSRASTVEGGFDLLEALGSTSASRGDRDIREVRAFAVQFPADIQENLDLLEELARKGIDLVVDPVARLAARKVVAWAERSVADGDIGRPGTYGKAKTPGVYRLDNEVSLTAASRVAEGSTIERGNSLMMIHGTFSSTEGAYSALAQMPEWTGLLDRYDGQAYSLEHKTLSVNPAQNALDLARQLPDHARLDMVSHSRGGLVGEILALAAARSLDPGLLHRPNQELLDEERKILSDLIDIMADKDVSIRSFVRVAAPARGTILASPRLDTVVKYLFNVIPKSSGPVAWMLAVLKSLILAFLDQRTDPRVIPGVEAMMPDSPFVRLVNASTLDASTDLAVIAGDVDRSRWLKWFVEKGLDLFYGQEHDYVVDTLSMYQGAHRNKAWVSLHAGPDVNHFTYFAQAESRQRLQAWIERDDEQTEIPEGFEPLDRDAPELVVAHRRRRGVDQPLVVVVPDLFGTALGSEQQGIVWPDPLRLAVDGMPAIGPPASLRPEGLLSATYRPLIEVLASEFEVLALSYDWRGSLTDAAAAFVEVVEEADEGTPVHVVAHGAGGLVVRHALNTNEGLRSRLRRILTLGTPNLGTLRSVELAAGRGRLVDKLQLLDPPSSRNVIGGMFRSYESVLESMPAEGVHRDPATWTSVGISFPGAGDATTGMLAAESWPDPQPIAVAGVSHLTPTSLVVSGPGFVFSGTRDGDGAVTAQSATHGSAAAYFVATSHGELPRHPEALTGYVDIIRDGRTNRLSRELPWQGDELEALPDTSGRHLYPSAVDLERAALWAGPSAAVEIDQVLAIEVVHGSVKFADHPVLVGHYAGSVIEGAEAALNAFLGDRLVERDVLGMYPGAIGTAEVVRSPAGARPPGAVVVGMGEIGTVSASGLATSVTEGVLRLALSEAEGAAETSEAGMLSIGVSAVLIGTSGATGFSIEESVRAIITGVANANRLLTDRAPTRAVRFDQLQFVELYEDLAIEAVKAIHRVTSGTGHRIGTQVLSAAKHLSTIEGGRSGQPPPEYNRDEWRPVFVESVPWSDDDPSHEYRRQLGELGQTERESDEPRSVEPTPSAQPARPPRRDLVFTSIGMAARSDKTVHAAQRALLERLTRQVIDQADPDPQFHNTLFELLLPRHLKESVGDADNLVLTLDNEATQYPWEMLAARTATGDLEKLAIRAGMIRRLLVRDAGENQRATGTKALVLGDPSNGRGITRLPGAVDEATAVAELLSASGFEVTRLIAGQRDFNDLDVLNALFAEEYRIIHIAAHGQYDTDPEKSGILLGDRKVLSPLTLRQMRAVPPLVFLNCCFLGTIDTDYNMLASSVSEQLIRDGVRAVVAAGWAVDDLAAKDFAVDFYGQMLRSVPYGKAVHRARTTTHDAHPGINTWGAYQCYGDPGFRLRTGRPVRPDRYSFVAPREMETAIIRLVEDTQSSRTDRDRIKDELEKVLAAGLPEWRTGAVLAAAGDCYGEIGELELAIDIYVQAISAFDARAPMRCVEQLANLEGRLAEKWALEEDLIRPSTRVRELIDRADTRLTALDQLATVPTLERLRLRAAHHKRRALIYRDATSKRLASLEASQDAYDAGRQLLLPTADPDTTINWALMAVLASLAAGEPLDNETKGEIRSRVDDARVEAKRRVRAKPEFWNRVADPDSELLLGLLDGDLAGRVEDIAGMYRDAFGDHATERVVSSVRNHIRFVWLMLDRMDQETFALACGRLHDLVAQDD